MSPGLITRRSALKAGGAALAMLVGTPLAKAFPMYEELTDCAQALDHLLLGTQDRDAGIAWFEKLTGVRAAIGGSHPGRGTCNALASLGGRHYLEIIAPDPAQPDAKSPTVTELKSLTSPRVIQWAAASSNMEATRRMVQASGLRFEGPTPGSRQRPDGRVLRWATLNLRDPSALLPFFIHWEADSIHPSQDSPSGCRLAGLRFEAPDPERISQQFAKLGLRAEVQPGKAAQVIVTLETPRGRVELGRGGRPVS